MATTITTDTTVSTAGDALWTDSTTPPAPPKYFTPPQYYIGVEPRGTITLRAQARVNKGTLQDRQLTEVMATVKHKLLKQLFEQLEKSGAVKIVSVPSDKTGSITFHASLELVQNDAKA